MLIRTAQENDLKSLTDIYNHEVLNGVATFDLHPKTPDERKEWFSAHNKDNHPLIVAELNNETAGYASLSPYREKEAYSQTVELSVYVDAKFRGMGIGSALMAEIIKLAKQDKRTVKIISVITRENETSCYLHKKFGFEYCGTITRVGKKFGKYLDIVNYSLDVGEE